MKRNFKGSLINPTVSALYNAVKHGINQGQFEITGNEDFTSALSKLDSIVGNEALSNNVAREAFSGMSENQKFSMLDAAGLKSVNVDSQYIKDVAGLEGFDLEQTQGSSVDGKAASITLNGLSQIQTKAAEQMFPTVTIGYAEENLSFTVRSAGIGRYVYGATAYDSSSSLRPITSLLRDGKFFLKDTLALRPVYPEKADDAARSFFVDPAKHAPWDVTYDNADPLHRTSHRTNYLAVGKTIPSLLGLSTTPGQKGFTSNDTIESNSIGVQSVLIEATVGSKTEALTIDTRSYSNRNFGPTTVGQSSDDRQLNMTIRRLTPASFKKNGVATDLFAPLQVNGMTPYFTFTLGGTYIRQTARFVTNHSELALEYIVDKDGNVHRHNTSNADIAAIMAKFTDGQVIGADFAYNHSNTNRTNFGYRMQVYDTMKVLPVRKETPISVIYPVSKEDTNESAVEDAIDQIVVALQANTTAKAFEAAEHHVNLVAFNNGSEIVGNEQASNIPAGMHFVTATYLPRQISLAESVSAMDSISVLEAVEKTLTAQVSEIIAALATNSGLAAINEYRNMKKAWTVVGHQNLLRYMMRQGESRTVGQGVDFTIEETNLDAMIGKFYIFPKSETEGTNIDVIGGMGITVAKTHQVIKANVTRDNADFGVMITQPAFQHHSVNAIVGVLEITDAKHALTEDGLVRYLSAQRVKLVDNEGKTVVPIVGGGETGGTDPIDLP